MMKPGEMMRRIWCAAVSAVPKNIGELLGRKTVRKCPWVIAVPAHSSSGMYLSPEIIVQLAAAYNPEVEMATVRHSERGVGGHWEVGPGTAYVGRLYADPAAESTMADAEIARVLLARCEQVAALWRKEMTPEEELTLIASTRVEGGPTALWASFEGIEMPWGGDGFACLIEQGFQHVSIGAYQRPQEEVWRLGHAALLGSELPAASAMPALRKDLFSPDAPSGARINTTPEFARVSDTIDSVGLRWIECSLDWSGGYEKIAAPGEPEQKEEEKDMALTPEDMKAIGDLIDTKIAAMKPAEKEEPEMAAATEQEQAAAIAASRQIGEASGLVTALFTAGRMTEPEYDAHRQVLELAQAAGGEKGTQAARALFEKLAPRAKAPTQEAKATFLSLLDTGSKVRVANPEVAHQEGDLAVALSTLNKAAIASGKPEAKAAMLALANSISGIRPAAGA